MSAADGRSTPPSPARKVAIILAYCGHGYQGMQNNPGAKTIESELELALFRSNAIPDPSTSPTPHLRRRYDFSRAARTDKGVSALFQVVSGVFSVDDEVVLAKALNFHLPEKIRVFAVLPTAVDFDAKKCCVRRRYVYLLPVFALDATLHCDRERVAESVGGLGRCLECSERGRKVFGLVARNSKDLKDFKNPRGVESFESSRLGLLNRSEDALLSSVKSSQTDEAAVLGCKLGTGKEKLALEKEGNARENLGHSQSNHCKNRPRPEEARQRFGTLLKRYVGTHNFHNLTTRIKPQDPSAWRHILSIDASGTLEVDGIEFVKCEIVGQSFMLHQIRKMIGLAVAVVRNCTSEALFDLAFKQDVNINVPTAPDVGLYLEECFFTSYNEKCNGTFEELSLSTFSEEAEEFKLKHIHPHIATMEKRYGAVGLWLHSLNHRNYPDFKLPESYIQRA